jgi:small GTP-binding protein
MNNDIKIIKLCILGDGGNGKTCIINRFIDDKYDNYIGETIGVDFKCKTIDSYDNKKIKIQIWDTAGQERFRQIIKVYFRDTDGIILTYDTTNYNSFKNLDNWMQQIKEIANLNYTSIILVGTKCDLIELRTVPCIDIAKFINNYNIKYLEVSSKESKNIDVLFKIFTEIVLKNMEINTRPPKKKILKIENYNNKQCCFY